MIERLRIKNLILIEECQIEFSSGLTIITGETGAGKTALTQALYLLCGQRADSSLVRGGESKAFIEASFCINEHTYVKEYFRMIGIELSDEDPLILARELSCEGRSRSFINGHAVALSVLQTVSRMMISLISQHSSHELKDAEVMRDIVDTFGEIEEVKAYHKAYTKEQKAKNAISSLSHLLLERERNAERFAQMLEEIESACLKEGEEEELFARFGLLSSAKQITTLIDEMTKSLNQGPRPMLKELSSFRQSAQALIPSCPHFAEVKDLLNEASLALQEVNHCLTKIAATIDADSYSSQALEERLCLYSKIKKKYGASYEDWMAYKKNLICTLERYRSLDEEQKQLQDLYELALFELNTQATALTQARIEAKTKLEKQLSAALQELNMPGSSLEIRLEPQKRTPHGEDAISFWLRANPGEMPSSIKENTSGGELSRLLLAIKTILAKKNNTATIVFDEIDANVGGKTASLIADKLHDLSKHRQVFCITHFAQVAKKGDAHIRICKKEKEGRTIALVETLDLKGRQLELLRMVGEDKQLL